MIRRHLNTFIIFISITIILIGSLNAVSASTLDDQQKNDCKIVIAMANATAGPYNLHMKVRDPLRGGAQVLFICEPGYNYTFHHPLTNQSINFTVNQRIIGTTASFDKPPAHMKPGMVLTAPGLSFGNADIPVFLHINENEYAWDDLDWLRFAYQTAGNEQEAVELLTRDAVDVLHATNIGETLFVVGPDRGYAIEADAYHYHIEEIKDVYVKSNYPEFLWESCSYFPDKYAPHLNSTFAGWAREGQVVRLGENCSKGVRLEQVTEEHVIARDDWQHGETTKLYIGENGTLGSFWVQLHDTEVSSDPFTVPVKRANITISYKYLAWRDHVQDLIQPRLGNITLQDMMAWSRLHSDDMWGLRGFCEGGPERFEAVNIFKHPDHAPELFSSLWYAGIPCSSIYVPVHVCAKDIYEPYKSGSAWNISLRLLENYSHGSLPALMEPVESVIITESSGIENTSRRLMTHHENITNGTLTELLTLNDNMLQRHAYQMQQILLNVTQLNMSGVNDSIAAEIDAVVKNVTLYWDTDYIHTLCNLKYLMVDIYNLIEEMETENNTRNNNSNNAKILDELNRDLLSIIDTAARYKIKMAELVAGSAHPKVENAKLNYEVGWEEIDNGSFAVGCDKVIYGFWVADELVENVTAAGGNGNGDDVDGDDNGGDDDGGGDDDDGGEENGDKDKDIDHTLDWLGLSYICTPWIILLVVFICIIAMWRKGRDDE